VIARADQVHAPRALPGLAVISRAGSPGSP
jgi:hypothetical protein